MLGTKLKFFTYFILIADQYKVIESALPVASSFASHVHTPHDEISDKIAQNNASNEMQTDDRNILNTLILLILFKSCMHVVLIHFKS